MKPTTIEEYFNSVPEHAIGHLNGLRSILKSIAPHATEEIKWGQPVLIEKRILFSYGAYKNFVRFMPTGPTLEHFKAELINYGMGKDTVQFRYDQELPVELIRRIAAHRYQDVMQNDAKWMY